jgi:hypothetical protein
MIMKQMRLTKDDYRLGKTKVFVRSPRTVRGAHTPDAGAYRYGHRTSYSTLHILTDVGTASASSWPVLKRLCMCVCV